MLSFPTRVYCEFVFKKETKNGLEGYMLRYSPTRTAEKQTTRVLERWADNPDINLTHFDSSYMGREIFSIRRKPPKKVSLV